jgi:hypothetical protein
MSAQTREMVRREGNMGRERRGGGPVFETTRAFGWSCQRPKAGLLSSEQVQHDAHEEDVVQLIHEHDLLLNLLLQTNVDPATATA